MENWNEEEESEVKKKIDDFLAHPNIDNIIPLVSWFLKLSA